MSMELIRMQAVSASRRADLHRTVTLLDLSVAASSGQDSPLLEENKMTSADRALRLPQSRTRVMRVSAGEAERQLLISAWLVAFLIAATAVTATAGFFA